MLNHTGAFKGNFFFLSFLKACNYPRVIWSWLDSAEQHKHLKAASQKAFGFVMLRTNCTPEEEQKHSGNPLMGKAACWWMQVCWQTVHNDIQPCSCAGKQAPKFNDSVRLEAIQSIGYLWWYNFSSNCNSKPGKTVMVRSLPGHFHRRAEICADSITGVWIIAPNYN